MKRRFAALAAALAFSAACGGHSSHTPSVEPRPLPARVRRLDNLAYERTVRELVHNDKERIAELLPPDVRHEGYSPNVEQAVPAAWAARLDRLVADIAARAVAERLESVAPCTSEDSAGLGCAPEFVERIGRRAFRRPLSGAERARLLEVFAEGARGNAGFAGGVELVLRVVLQSPNLLYMSELGSGGASGERVRLTSPEIATLLAYTLRGAPPDDELLDLASRDVLLDPAVRRAQARRLLGMRDTREQFQRFVLEWLEVDGLERTAKNVELFPEYDDLKLHMLAETRAFVDEVMVHGGASVRSLLGAGFASVGTRMARFYGLPTYGARASLASTRRLGILQHASFLAAHAHGDGTSPVRRGDFVLRKLLCNELPRPSELGIEIVMPVSSKTHTTRERFSAHVSDASCRGCHRSLDGIGFTFEGFDAVGRERATENGRPVDTRGAFVAADGEFVWKDSVEMTRWLVTRPEVDECFARHAFRYFTAQSDPAVEESLLRLYRTLPEERAGNIVEALVLFVESDLFVEREMR